MTDRAAQSAVSLMADRRGCRAVLLRLTYLAVTNAFGMLRLLSSNGNCTEREFSSPAPGLLDELQASWVGKSV